MPLLRQYFPILHQFLDNFLHQNWDIFELLIKLGKQLTFFTPIFYTNFYTNFLQLNFAFITPIFAFLHHFFLHYFLHLFFTSFYTIFKLICYIKILPLLHVPLIFALFTPIFYTKIFLFYTNIL